MATKKKATETLAEEIKEIDKGIQLSEKSHINYENSNIMNLSKDNFNISLTIDNYVSIERFEKEINRIDRELKKSNKYRWTHSGRRH